MPSIVNLVSNSHIDLRSPDRSPRRTPNRSPRRTPNRSPSPAHSVGRVPAYRRTRSRSPVSMPDDIVLTVHEGLAARELLTRIPALVPLCVHAINGQGVTNNYVRGELGESRMQSRFAILATRQGTPVGFVLCTVHSAFELIPLPRIVSVDLICTQGTDPIKGMGSVLLQELTEYAASRLGADILVMDSVTDPRTVRAYLRNGFVRGPDACRGRMESALAKDFARTAYKKLLHKAPELQHNRNLMAALNRGHYERYNKINNRGYETVFFSKCLQRLRNRAGGSDAPRLRSQNGFFNFQNQRTYLLGAYRLRGTRLVPR